MSRPFVIAPLPAAPSPRPPPAQALLPALSPSLLPSQPRRQQLRFGDKTRRGEQAGHFSLRWRVRQLQPCGLESSCSCCPSSTPRSLEVGLTLFPEPPAALHPPSQVSGLTDERVPFTPSILQGSPAGARPSLDPWSCPSQGPAHAAGNLSHRYPAVWGGPQSVRVLLPWVEGGPPASSLLLSQWGVGLMLGKDRSHWVCRHLQFAHLWTQPSGTRALRGGDLN